MPSDTAANAIITRVIGGNVDRKGHAAVDEQWERERELVQGGKGCALRRSYVSPDRYVKEIRLWIERTREREREQHGVCVMSDPFTGFGEDGANRVVGI